MQLGSPAGLFLRDRDFPRCTCLRVPGLHARHSFCPITRASALEGKPSAARPEYSKDRTRVSQQQQEIDGCPGRDGTSAVSRKYARSIGARKLSQGRCLPPRLSELSTGHYARSKRTACGAFRPSHARSKPRRLKSCASLVPFQLAVADRASEPRISLPETTSRLINRFRQGTGKLVPNAAKGAVPKGVEKSGVSTRGVSETDVRAIYGTASRQLERR
jgi:hypothetical protein